MRFRGRNRPRSLIERIDPDDSKRTENDMNASTFSTAFRADRMDADRRAAFYTGVLFIITFITSIPALLLFDPVLNDANYIVSGGDDNRIFLGAFLELLLIIANIGSAIVPFAILKRQNEGLALGFVAARVMESVFIAVGILSVLAVVAMRQDGGGAGGADAASLVIAGQSLVSVKDLTFMLGPGFVVGIGNGMILGYLMYRSGLVPRRMAMFGLVGGPLVCASGIAVMFGVTELGSTWHFVATIPEIIWEVSLGIWLTVKGFNASSRILSAPRLAAQPVAAD
jgi:hypothetical protein